MGRLGTYKVELKGLNEASATYNWVVGNDFFALVEGEDVQKGNVNVQLTVTKEASLFNLDFELEGNAIVSCDRCLDDLSLPIETTGNLKIKLGEDFDDDGEILIVPEEDGTVNVAWYIYEFIVLSLPLKKVHAPGKCNREMMSKLSEHLIDEVADDSEDSGMESGEIDPRWNELKKIIEINKKTKAKSIVMLLGYPIVAFSKITVLSPALAA